MKVDGDMYGSWTSAAVVFEVNTSEEFDSLRTKDLSEYEEIHIHENITITAEFKEWLELKWPNLRVRIWGVIYRG